jgi:hypothetical protein
MMRLMAETKKPNKTETKSETKQAESKAAAPSDTSPQPSSGDEPGKSARDSVGGAAAGHYGFFSNIKTPEYKSGWDDIWGKQKRGLSKNAPITNKKPAIKRNGKRVVAFDFEDLPAELQDGLIDAAKVQLKKSRINYENRTKAGAVSWRIECTVER